MSAIKLVCVFYKHSICDWSFQHHMHEENIWSQTLKTAGKHCDGLCKRKKDSAECYCFLQWKRLQNEILYTGASYNQSTGICFKGVLAWATVMYVWLKWGHFLNVKGVWWKQQTYSNHQWEGVALPCCYCLLVAAILSLNVNVQVCIEERWHTS